MSENITEITRDLSSQEILQQLEDRLKDLRRCSFPLERLIHLDIAEALVKEMRSRIDRELHL